jgi:sugar O-acyltransferase (sialic acid O-acetyltransferase NeuD family)
MRSLVIFGAGDLARVAHVYFTRDSDYQVAAFSVDRAYVGEGKLCGLNVVPFDDLPRLFPAEQCDLFVAIGFKRVNRLRAETYGRCKDAGYTLATYVSSKALTMGDVQFGDNCFILENNVIQPFVKIGNDTIIWSGNHIGHDSTIGNHCFIASHAVISGNVKIDDHCFIGVNATFRDGVHVAQRCVIGAGALILKDTIVDGVYAEKGTEPAAIKSFQLRSF